MENATKKLLFGMALGAAVLMAAPGRATAAPCEGDLFVAVRGVPDLGDGSAGNPFRTITKAVERARQIRSDGCTSPIVIHVEPGDYVGRSVTGGSTVEALPILIDVPDIELRGWTVLETDTRGLPTGTFSSPTTLTVDPSDDAGALSALVFVAPGGNHVAVTGFVLAANGGVNDAATYQTVDVAIDRVQDFIFRGNVAKDSFIGVSTRAASGLVEANYVSNNFLGLGITGGNAASPANVIVKGNRATGNGEAAMSFAGTGDTAYPFNPRVESTVNETFDTIVGTATGNDFSDSVGSVDQLGNHLGGAGLRLMHQTAQTLASASRVTATISDNTMDKNAFGIEIDGGLSYRTFTAVPDPRLFTGSTVATFENDAVSNSSSARALVTFTHPYAAQDPQQLLIPKGGATFKYLQNSTHTITHTGELEGLWIDHPVQDLVDCRTVCNDLQINGVEMPPPIRSAGLGPAFLQSFIPLAPIPSACPPPLRQCAPQL